jgi:hypothetical protein
MLVSHHEGPGSSMCMDKVAMGQVFLCAPWLPPVSVIPTLLHIHSFIHSFIHTFARLSTPTTLI